LKASDKKRVFLLFKKQKENIIKKENQVTKNEK
jgi:hypothetical protein